MAAPSPRRATSVGRPLSGAPAVRDLVALARPKEWLKNVLIGMPIPFALVTGARLHVETFVLGVVGFALITSAVYACNDACDADADSRHPRKQRRPVAAGRVRQSAAFTFAGVLFLGGGVLLALTRSGAAVLIGGIYVTVNLLYNLGGRRLPLIDVFCVASGFVLRVLLGCVLLGVPPSSWLLLCTSTLALLISLGKRRAEVGAGLDVGHRASLAGYTDDFLSHALAITASVALVSYGLYCVEGRVLRPGREFASLPFVMFGILEYVRRVQVDGAGESPVDMLLSSPSLVAAAVGWLVAVVWSTGLI